MKNLYERIARNFNLDYGIVTQIAEQLKPVRRRVRIKYPYDLRTDQVEKSLDCAKGEDWTAFINQKQTLAHVMRWGHPSLMIRLPKLDMKGMSNRDMKKLMEIIMHTEL